METVSEKSTTFLSVSFKDENGNPATPSTVSYNVYDEASGTQVLADTAIAAASSVTIQLNPTDNTLVDPTKTREVRVVTVTSVYGDPNDVMIEKFRYEVVNLIGVPS